MSDNLHKRHSGDQDRINIHEPYEVRDWCKKFNCTSAELTAAVKAVGVMAKDVEKHLKGK